MHPSAPARLIPLSEDERLSLVDPRELVVQEGDKQNWNEVTIIGRGERRSVSLDVRVEPRAHGQMIRIFVVPEGARLTILHKVRLAEAASWQNVICIRGRGEVKIRRAIEVLGTGAEVRLACLGVMDDFSRISVSDEIFSHASHTKNDLRTKIVLNNAARSEVRGRIVVGEESTQSNSYERLDHLVLGDQAGAVAIPELEVKTDNVKCGHGATSGRPSEAELFYLLSRGLSLTAAERLLAQGFVSDALHGLPERSVQDALATMFN
ncbi:MAG: SufD family Fe-S cluster assembly protein [Patescibacteria group bacterium]